MKSIDLLHLLSGSFHAMLEVTLITVTASGLYTRQVQRKEMLDSLTDQLALLHRGDLCHLIYTRKMH